MSPVTAMQLAALADAVREIRGRERLSQWEVAAGGDLNRNTVGQIEREEIASPSLGVLLGLADGLGVTLGELVAVYEARLEQLAR